MWVLGGQTQQGGRAPHSSQSECAGCRWRNTYRALISISAKNRYPFKYPGSKIPENPSTHLHHRRWWIYPSFLLFSGRHPQRLLDPLPLDVRQRRLYCVDIELVGGRVVGGSPSHLLTVLGDLRCSRLVQDSSRSTTGDIIVAALLQVYEIQRSMTNLHPSGLTLRTRSRFIIFLFLVLLLTSVL